MLARAVPGAIVAVAEDRHLAGALAERRLGATVHVLDDGFQHVQLARDLDVLVTRDGRDRQRPRAAVRPAARSASMPRLAPHFVVVIGRRSRQTARSEAWDARGQSVRGGDGARRRRVRRAPAGATGAPERHRCEGGSGACRRGDWQPGAVLRDAARRPGMQSRGTIAFRRSPSLRAAATSRGSRQRRASAGATVVVTTEKDAVRLERLGAVAVRVDRRCR